MLFNLHFVTDLLSAALGSASGWWLYRRYLMPAGLAQNARRSLAYWMVLVVSAALGAYWLGTLNLIVSSHPGIGRSVFGAVLGAVVGIELYKLIRGQRGSTGAVFVLPLALGLGIGRVGCFLAGMDDFTFGTPTSLPWAHDFGDGIPRHPTQLYEIGFAGLLWWGLTTIRQRLAAQPGLLFKLLLVAYLGWRLLVDAIKPLPYAYPLGLSGIQWVCLLGLAIYLPVVWRQWPATVSSHQRRNAC